MDSRLTESSLWEPPNYILASSPPTLFPRRITCLVPNKYYAHLDAGAQGDTKIEMTIAFNLQNQVKQGGDTLARFQSVTIICRPGSTINGIVAFNMSLANRGYIEQTLDVLASFTAWITTILNSTVGLMPVLPFEGAQFSLLLFVPKDVADLSPLEGAFMSIIPLDVIFSKTTKRIIARPSSAQFTISSFKMPAEALQSLGIR
ncbi:hypothetical protein RvY_14814 [Ramazzottius varieornatus]|uniref:Serpin domain-containing protein n=1 Tax=Ramazzottius varieornatus TaxID=947166 RepID=A0A1D1VUD9_RAMVA|nr:hypothetical protein RvY_14814 [Ramazzottius varieornatus]